MRETIPFKLNLNAPPREGSDKQRATEIYVNYPEGYRHKTITRDELGTILQTDDVIGLGDNQLIHRTERFSSADDSRGALLSTEIQTEVFNIKGERTQLRTEIDACDTEGNRHHTRVIDWFHTSDQKKFSLKILVL